MTIDTWVSVAALAGVMLTLGGLIIGQTRWLHAEIKELRTELKADNAKLRTELKADHAELRTELKADHAELRTELKGDNARLDERVFALAVGLRPLVDQAQKTAEGSPGRATG